MIEWFLKVEKNTQNDTYYVKKMIDAWCKMVVLSHESIKENMNKNDYKQDIFVLVKMWMAFISTNNTYSLSQLNTFQCS